MSDHAVQIYKNSHPMSITFTVSKYPSETLGQFLRRLRLELGLTQKQLAQKIQVNEMTVVGWEKSLREPRGGNVLKLARFFGTQGEVMFEMLSKNKR